MGRKYVDSSKSSGAIAKGAVRQGREITASAEAGEISAKEAAGKTRDLALEVIREDAHREGW